MFERALLDHTIHESWDERSRRGLTALTSFGLQALAVGVLLILPLLRPQGLPFFRQLSTPVSLAPPPGEPLASRTHTGGNPAASSNPADIFLRQPQRIPNHVETGKDDAPPQIGSGGLDIPGAVGGTGGQDGVFRSIGTGSRPIIPAAPAPVVHSVHISHMSEGDLVRKVLPTYPPPRSKCTHSRDSPVAGDNKQSRHHRKPSTSLRPSHARAGGDRSSASMALPALYLEQ
jgi:hypothetical protein